MRKFLLSVVVLATLGAGCAGSSPADDQADEPGDAGQVEVGAGVPVSPLESALGFASDPGRRQFQLIAMQRAADDAIVQCMKRAGFFYAARPAEDAFRTGPFVGDGSRSWTEANGMGITSSFVEALAADAARTVDSDATNLDYVASLTPQQAADYDRALVGERPEDAETAEYTPAGCWGESFTEILRLLAVIDEFEVQLASLNSRLHSDPRVLRFEQTWSACMAEAGYRYGSESDLIDDVYARLLEVELVENDGVTQVVAPDALDALAAFERAAATASFDCRSSFVTEFDRLRFDYEQEFLDDNRFRIAELIPPEE